jgi:hypothetical protein
MMILGQEVTIHAYLAGCGACLAANQIVPSDMMVNWASMHRMPYVSAGLVAVPWDESPQWIQLIQVTGLRDFT